MPDDAPGLRDDSAPAALTPGRRARLLAEMAGIYLLAPLAVYGLVQWGQLPLFRVLAPVIALFLLAFALDRSFSWRRLLLSGITGTQLWRIFSLFAVLGAGILGYAYFAMPESFLSFPRYRPQLWATVMLLYPLISVTAQELVYRVFFLHRYGRLFGDNIPLATAVNAGLFAFGHILFESWITVIISFAGGLIFAWRYFSTRSFWAVCLEHALYGNLIFTAGLGRYFFTGIPLG